MAKNLTMNDFYCINCGKKVLTLPRKRSNQREKFHRKKLYCFNCHLELNCIECKNDYEYYQFREMFENGELKEEAKQELEMVF